MHVNLIIDNQQVQGEQIMLVWCHVVMHARSCHRSATVCFGTTIKAEQILLVWCHLIVVV